MITIVYASRAAHRMSGVELAALLRTASERNLAVGVTGMLLYAHGSFMQQIEGDDDAVDAIFASIERDPRHEDIRLLSRRPVAERRFPEWSMGFERPDDDALVARLPGYQPPGEMPLVSGELVRDAGMAEALLAVYAADRRD